MVNRLNPYEHLETFQGIKLTHREIDVIACILNGRTSKKAMAEFLSIEPRTAETHVRNVIHKLRCSSWEHVRDQVSNSAVAANYHTHFDFLKLQKQFIGLLQKIPTQRSHTKESILILYDQHIKKELLDSIKQIRDYFLDAGFFVVFKRQQEEHLISAAHKEKYIVLINVLMSENLTTHQYHDYTSIINLVLTETNANQSDNPKTILSKEHNSLFHLMVSILTHMLPNSDLIQELSVFSKYTPEDLKSFSSHLGELLLHDEKKQTQKRWRLLLYSLCIGIVGLFVYQRMIYDPVYVHSVQRLPEASIVLNRDKIVYQMSKLLKMGHSKSTIPIVVLVGVGGAGKTTLTRLWSKQNSHHKIIWEINAETPESLKVSFKELATALAKTPALKEQLSIIESMQDSVDKDRRRLSFVQEHLRKASDWVLIFDNATHLTDFSLYFPQNPKIWGTKGKIIITTRNARFKTIDYIPLKSIVNIDALSVEEKRLLFTRIHHKYSSIIVSPEQEKEVDAFLDKIPPFPLDISLAAKYLVNYKMSFEEYLEKLKLQNRLFEAQLDTTLKETNEYTKTRYSIITLSIEPILSEHPELLKPLLMVSLLHATHIPLDLLISYSNKDHVMQLVQRLQQSSLCVQESISGGHEVVTLHRSIQENIHGYLKSQISANRYQQTVRSVADVLADHLNTNINTQNPGFIKLLLPHSEFVLHQNAQALSHTELSVAIGGAYYELGEDLKAIAYLDSNIKRMRVQNQGNTIDFARASSYLGVVAMRRGEFKQSLELLERAIPVYKTSTDIVGYVRTLVFLGHLYTLIDRYAESETTFNLGIDLCANRALGSTNLPRALVFSGILYREMGQYAKAMSATEESIKLYKSGIPHMWALAYLGSIELELGNYSAATDMLSKSISFYRGNNAAKHVSLGWILPTLGSIYRKMGKYDEALGLFHEAAEIYHNTNTETNRNLGTPFPLVHMGKLETILGHHTKALQTLDTALKEHIKIYGQHNIRTQWAEMALAHLYLDTGNFEKAKDLIEDCLSYYKSLLPQTHPKIGKAYRALGVAYMGLGDFTNAQISLEKAQTIITHHFQVTHLESAYTFKVLGDLAIHQSRYEHAEGYLNKAIKIYEQHNHPFLYMYFESYGALFLKKATYADNKEQQNAAYAQGRKYFQKALSIARKTFPKDSEHIKRLYQRIRNMETIQKRVVSSSARESFIFYLHSGIPFNKQCTQVAI